MSPRFLAYLMLAFSPFFFSSNLIIGSLAVQTIEPFTLTFFRWGLAFLIVLPFAFADLSRHKILLLKEWKLLLLNAFLAMGVCGTGVYWALKYTSATNGTLIYATAPVFILLMEWFFRGRTISRREVLGVILAFTGIAFIVFRGSWDVVMSVEFNSGDILFVLAAIGWSIYSVLSKNADFQSVSTIGMFAIIALIGALIQVPFALWEVATVGGLPSTQTQWISLLGLAFVSSVLAFIAYQYGIRVLGPAPAGIFMYLLPPVGVLLAVLFLGERFLPFHQIGLLFVMSGVIIATMPNIKGFGKSDT